MIRDGNAGFLHHRKVVGAVADGDGPFVRDPELIANFAQFRGLDLRVDDAAGDFAGEFAVFEFEFVRQGVVERW